MTEERTSEKRAEDLWAMGHSIALINGIVGGAIDADEPAEDRQDIVDRNTSHLRQMVAKEDWDDEDFTDANLAIEAGSNYTAS
jgi:hypothetical protein